ncbi:hypothetical protein AcV7_005484 [Taiwanofungus camphoratus]|nr:hypothetical protein AcV7_005484 [Antrodia cinnamomea]KAI0926590.1 hypothetical protein AcV7_005484 [Antrodia cinnamomea]
MLLTPYCPAGDRFLVKPSRVFENPLFQEDGHRQTLTARLLVHRMMTTSLILLSPLAVRNSTWDALFLVVEVKRDGTKSGATSLQAERYTTWVQDNQQGMLPFAGVNDQTSAVILACGVKCTVLKLYASGICNMSFVDITSDGMHIVLNDLRIAYGHFDDV